MGQARLTDWIVGRGAAAAVIALSLSTAACPSAGTDARPLASLGGMTADTPWPSDVFLVDGHLRVTELGLEGRADSVSGLAAALDELDGAPVLSSIFFPTNGGALPDGPMDGAAHLVDLTPGAVATRVELSLFHRESTHEIVALAPSAGVLTEGHLYGCYVDDKQVRPSPQLAAALRGDGPQGGLYAPLVAYVNVADAGMAIGAATVFTVGHPTDRLYAMTDALEASTLPHVTVTSVLHGAALEELFGKPTTTRPGLGDPDGIVHEAIGWVVLGTFDAPSYLSRGEGKLGLVEVDAKGTPLLHGVTQVPFMLTLPKLSGSLASTPIMIFQHGLNAGRSQVGAVANDYARAGFATIGIDALWHGGRRPGAVDLVHNYTGKDGPDGLADNDEFGAAISFFDFNGDLGAGIAPLDARYVRSNFNQAVLDVAALVRLVKRGDVSAVAASDPALAGFTLDRTHVIYTGESFGSILGAQVAAVAPDLDAAVLSVPGAGIFLPMFAESPYFSGFVSLFLKNGFDPTLDVAHTDVLPAGAQRSLSLLQAAIGPGDPASFAPYITHPRVAAGKPPNKTRALLLLQAYSDELIPNQSGELLASASRASVVEVAGATHPLRFVTLPTASAPMTASAGGTMSAIVNLDPATHTMFTSFRGDRRYVPGATPRAALPQPAIIDNPTELAHALTIELARSVRAGGPARVGTH